MPRITTQQSHDYVKKEYRSRLFSTFFWFCSLSVLFSIIFLLPSYLLLNFYQNTYQLQTREDSQVQTQKMNEEYDKKLEEVYVISQKINVQPLEYVKVIETLYMYGNGIVNFDAIELSTVDDTVSVTLRGRAALRDQLLQFEKKINNDSRFKDFKLPIEVLTKQEDLSFNVTFTYHEK